MKVVSIRKNLTETPPELNRDRQPGSLQDEAHHFQANHINQRKDPLMPSKTESAGTMAERMPRDLDNADDFPGLKEQEKLLQQFRSHLLSSFPARRFFLPGRRKRIFTLIELLIVIAIICIL